MHIRQVVLLLVIFTTSLSGSGQIMEDYLGDETNLYAATKQVNQFFRRFNGEEDLKGERYYPEDRYYRDQRLRETYLSNLFNNETGLISSSLKSEFIEDVNDPTHPKYLDFHGGGWFAEVTTKFIFKGSEQYLSLFLQLEKDTVGSKWVITNVFFEPFQSVFADQDSLRKAGQKFLHPMSHELDFMNLIRAFQDKNSLENYVAWKYHPDYLTLFIYEFKQGNLQFQTITRVRFHFFQVDGWYFQIAEYNRQGNNSGWLIASLMKISEEDRVALLKFIYHE